MQLASRFARTSAVLRSDLPLSDDQIHGVAQSIFTARRHDSRSARYTHIPTIDMLRRLRDEGFLPFMLCQARARDQSRHAHARHMVRLRHATQIDGAEANEIILLNSHDGSSSYQMLAGVFRFVCQNGLVCGTTLADIRVAHKGDVADNVIGGAYQVLQDFERVTGVTEAWKALELKECEQRAFARAALSLKYDIESLNAAPVTVDQILQPRREADSGQTLWTTFNRIQEHLVAGGVRGRTKDGRRVTTRPVSGIEQNLKLNRSLWMLAEEMRRLKA